MNLVKSVFTTKIYLLTTITLLLVVFFLSSSKVFASNPTTINFQGKVVNSNSTNVSNGNYTFTFKLYTVASGGTSIWAETQPNVLVSSGIFQVNLGSVCPFFIANSCNNNTPINFSSSSTIYLGITFNNDPAGEMTPRILFQSVPFAFNSDQVGGLTVDQLVQLSPTIQQIGNINVSGSGTFGGNLTTLGTLGVTGLSTLSGGVTSPNINTASGINTSLGNATGTFGLTSTGLNVSTTGAITGATGLDSSGVITLQDSTYTNSQLLVNDGQVTTPPTIPSAYKPALTVITSEVTGSRPLFFAYNNGAGAYASFLDSGACGSFNYMCLDLGNASTSFTALQNVGTTLNVGGGADGNFSVTNLASGSTTVAGALGVTGVTTLNNTLGVSGDTTLSGAGTGLTVTNDASIGGVLGVTGLTTLSGGLTAANINTISNVIASAGTNIANTRGSSVSLNNAGPLSGNSVSFSSANSDYLSTTNSLTGPQVFTEMAWFNTTSSGTIMGFDNNQLNAASSYDRMVWVDPTGHIVAGVYPNAVKEITSTNTYNDGAWHLMAMTLSSSGFYLYIDGTLVASSTSVVSAQNYTGYWHIGWDNPTGGWADAPTNDYFNGSLAGVAIFPIALSLNEVNGIYSSSSFTNYSNTILSYYPSDYWSLQSTGSLSSQYPETLNTAAGTSTTIGNATGTFGLTSSGLNVDTLGNLTGVASISSTGSYTQSGTSLNTLTGDTTLSGAGTGLTVTNDASIGGSLATGEFNDTLTDTGTITHTITNDVSGYFLESNSTTTNLTFTSTFDVTGLPVVDGTVAAFTVESVKSATSAKQQHTTILQIAGNLISTVSTANTTAASTTDRSFVVMRMNGIWEVIGEGLVAIPANTATTTNLADFAEWIPYSGGMPQSGDILSVGGSSISAQLSGKSYDPTLIGVVSTTPYSVAGANDGHSVVLALTGRVPVKVSLENGVINPGDPITSSSVPGVGMLSTRSGQIIGKALTGFSGPEQTGTIMVQLGVGYDNPVTALLAQSNGVDFLSNNINSALNISQISNFNNSVNFNLTTSGSSVNISSNLNSTNSAVSVNVTPTNKTPLSSSGIIINQLSSNHTTSNGLENGLLVNNSSSSTPIMNAINVTNTGGAGYVNLINSKNFIVDSLGNISASSLNLNNGLTINNTLGNTVVKIGNNGNETLSGGISVLNASISSDLSVGGVATFTNLSVFQKLATFIATTVFQANVTFNGSITVNNNTAGFAILNPGEDMVHVTFSQPYLTTPVVTANIINGQFNTLSINNVSTTGFDISVPSPVINQTKINWTAILVNNPNTAENSILTSNPSNQTVKNSSSDVISTQSTPITSVQPTNPTSSSGLLVQTTK